MAQRRKTGEIPHCIICGEPIPRGDKQNWEWLDCKLCPRGSDTKAVTCFSIHCRNVRKGQVAHKKQHEEPLIEPTPKKKKLTQEERFTQEERDRRLDEEQCRINLAIDKRRGYQPCTGRQFTPEEIANYVPQQKQASLCRAPVNPW